MSFFVIIPVMRKSLLFLLAVFFFAGCAHVQEVAKSIWGSSTKALEDARGTATTKMYECFPGSCFDKVLEIASENEYDPFIRDRKRHLIVVVHTRVVEAVSDSDVQVGGDTTEVGIFITPLKLKEVKVEIVSLSSSAQQRVSNAIFSELDKAFPEIKEIPLL